MFIHIVITRNILNLAKMDTYYYATVGKPIKVNPVIAVDSAEAWKEKTELTYTVNGKTVEITYKKSIERQSQSRKAKEQS